MPEEHPDFGRVLEAVRGARPGPVIVLGAVDCGKTTLVRQLASALARDGPVRVVAGDPGQAWLGPPTTLARARLMRPPRAWSRVVPERMIFLGATSPAGCVHRTASAIARLAKESIPGGEPVIVDTPGLVFGPLAEALWGGVAARLRPPLVVAIQESDELAPVLRPFHAGGSQVVVAQPHPLARVRRQAERAAFRAAAYRRYFGRARLRFIRGDVPVVSAFSGRPAAPDVGCLAGLRDPAGWAVGLGVVRGAGARRIVVLTPLADLSAVASLAVGTLRLDADTGAEA